MKRKVDEIDLSQITEFNPALIYGFDPQAAVSDRKSQPEKFPADYCLHVTGQFEDMFNAYLYAQNEVLATLRRSNIDELKPAQILIWLDGIHGHIAKTLVEDQHANGQIEACAGAPATRQLYRFRQCDIQLAAKTYISGNISLNQVYQYCEENELDKKHVTDFLSLLKDLAERQPDARFSAIESRLVVSPLYKGDLAFSRLKFFYHKKILTPDELIIVDRIMTIVAHPDEFPAIRQKFAEDFLADLKRCLKTDQTSILKLCHSAFVRITHGHVYFDGNGRTATCFLNTWLRYFGLPSILVRNPSERNDVNSSYHISIKCVDSNPEPLLCHLSQRLEETKKTGGYQNDLLAQTFHLRVKVKAIVLTITKYFPDYPVNANFGNCINQSYSQLTEFESKLPTDEQYVIGLKYLLSAMEKELQKLISERDEKIIKSYSLPDLSSDSLAKGLRNAVVNNKILDVHYFIYKGVDVNAVDQKPNNKKSAMHWAVIKDRPQILKILLEAKATESKDALNKTPSDYVTKQSHAEIIKLLGVTPPPNAEDFSQLMLHGVFCRD